MDKENQDEIVEEVEDLDVFGDETVNKMPLLLKIVITCLILFILWLIWELVILYI